MPISSSSSRASAASSVSPSSTRPPGNSQSRGSVAVGRRASDHKGDPFVFAIRNTATYEHVYYGRGGKLRKEYLRTVVHGSGFALRVQSGETLLVTNEHVASRPEVTDDEHAVDGVPPGSKKVREQLKIVRDEADDYEPAPVALA